MISDKIGLCLKASIVFVILGLFLLLVTVLLMPDEHNWGVLPTVSVMFIVFGGMLILPVLYEIITAKNEGMWKALWFLAIILLSIFGSLLYLLIGRKSKAS